MKQKQITMIKKATTQINFMTAMIIFLWLLLICVEAEDSRFIVEGGGIVRREKQPRAIRGFLNQMPIPRGFGKRDQGLSEDPLEQFRLNDDKTSFSIDWLATAMQNNLPLAKTVLHKFVDANGDGVLSTDELLRTSQPQLY